MRLSFRPALSVTSLIIAACSRAPAPASIEEQCKVGCERLAKFNMAVRQKSWDITVHEAGERVETMERSSAADIKELRAEMAAPDTGWNEDAIKKMPARAQKILREQHEWDAKQLQSQREAAIKSSEASLVEARRDEAGFKAQAAEWKQKTSAELNAKCLPACTAKSLKFASCLGRIQALEDAVICEQQ